LSILINKHDVINLRYFYRFLLSIVASQSLVFFIHQHKGLASFVQYSLADWVTDIYRYFFTGITVNGNVIIVNSERYLIIDNECTALMLSASVASAIFALNYSLLSRIFSIVISLLLIQFENILRILHLIFEIQKPDNLFNFYHLYIWQGINFLTAVVVILIAEQMMKRFSINHQGNKDRPWYASYSLSKKC
jgi:exosortase/archaeosortase family protein